MKKKIKIILLVVIIVLLVFLLKNFFILGCLYDKVDKIINTTDNYKFTQTSIVDQSNLIRTELKKDNIVVYKNIWNTDNSELNNNTSRIFWKNIETDEEILVNMSGEKIVDNLEYEAFNMSPILEKSLLWKYENKSEFIKKFYFFNLFNFIYDGGYYKIKMPDSELYMKIKCDENVYIYELYTNKDEISLKQELQINCVAEDDVKKIY